MIKASILGSFILLATGVAIPTITENGFTHPVCYGKTREVWFQTSSGVGIKVADTKAGGQFFVLADSDYYDIAGRFHMRKGNFDYVCDP